jgi:hypothetical protein
MSTPVPPAPTVAASDDIPVSVASLQECLDSARYWIQLLPAYANAMQRRADRLAIAAGLLAAITGLSVWTDFQQASNALGRWTVVAVSLLSAMLALMPRVKNYGEMAGHARELSANYGQVSGALLDLWFDQGALGTPDARNTIKRFDEIKAGKDSNLRDLPLKPTGNVARDEHGVAQWPLNVYDLARRRQSLPS